MIIRAGVHTTPQEAASLLPLFDQNQVAALDPVGRQIVSELRHLGLSWLAVAERGQIGEHPGPAPGPARAERGQNLAGPGPVRAGLPHATTDQLDVADVASRLGRSERTVRRWARLGKLRGRQLRGGVWTFDRLTVADHERRLNGGTRAGRPGPGAGGSGRRAGAA